MRIDKFLKVSRLIKRREVAKQLCLSGDILINGKPAKPMSEICGGEEVNMTLGKHSVTFLVREAREFANKEQAEAMYEIIKDEIKGQSC